MEEYIVNFLADIDVKIEANSPEEAREKAKKMFGEYYKELYQKNLFVEEDYQRAGFVFLVNNDTDKAIELCTKYLKYLGNNNTFIGSMKMSYEQIKQYITLEDYILFVNQIFMNI